MKEIVLCIEELRLKLEKYKRDDLKEFPTRTIFIDPLLYSLGWDFRDQDEVQLEYTTIDGKSVDYAMKINRKPVLFLEAKPLKDNLDDVKAITQVVGYAANEGIDWCILTNGVTYKVYKSSEKVGAPDKLLYEVSIDPKDSEDRNIQEIAENLSRFSKQSIARGVLDEIGELVFTTGKVRKALDKILLNPPNYLLKLIRSSIKDDSIRTIQIKSAIQRLWAQTTEVENVPMIQPKKEINEIKKDSDNIKRGIDQGEDHHIAWKPQEVLELYRNIDKFCKELDPINIKKKYLAKHIGYKYGKIVFCCIHIQKSGLRIWVKIKFSDIIDPPIFVRDVSKIGHWGVGDTEIKIDSFNDVKKAKEIILMSFEQNN
jgi:predicted transport protein